MASPFHAMHGPSQVLQHGFAGKRTQDDRDAFVGITDRPPLLVFVKEPLGLVQPGGGNRSGVRRVGLGPVGPELVDVGVIGIEDRALAAVSKKDMSPPAALWMDPCGLPSSSGEKSAKLVSDNAVAG